MSTLTTYKRALQQFQSRRLQRDHSDLSAIVEYRALSAFAFTELYGPRDFRARDAQARQIVALLHYLPGLGLDDILQIFTLLELSDRLDESVAQLLHAMQAPLNFSEATYERAYLLANNYADRRRQLDAIRQTLNHVHVLARNPLLGAALDHSGTLAWAVGLPDIHRFLRLGYHALNPVRDIAPFVTAIHERERARLDRIYSVARPLSAA